jgi:hypothetical protein
MSDPAHQSDCPSCGIAVAAGYLRCPKCHTEMPGGTAPSFDGSAERVAGGTSVTTGDSSRIWIAAAIGLMAVAVVVFLVARGGDDKAAAPADSGGQAAPAPSPKRSAQRPAPTPSPVTAPETDDEVVVPPAQRVAGVANMLRDRLDGARLWSTVDLEGTDGLSIHSGYCSDEQMPGLIDALADDLRGAGLVRVTCYERHGAKVFARELVAAEPE